MKTLRELHEGHVGKVSDKWSLYLDEYERVLSGLRDRPVRLLEIGVQNGGSLETWARYFPAATTLVGCDINPDCAKLTYDDPRIAIIVGDANLDETERAITTRSPSFDVIIDDGSHRSSDIVRSFARWFLRLADGGLYVIEDLHCSYWRSHEGGLHDPFSSLAFMKSLTDVVSYEHWGVARTRRQELAPFEEHYGVTLDEGALERVHSIELLNSMAIVRKAAPATNLLGRRVVVGTNASVSRDPIAAHDTSSTPGAQHDEGSLMEQLNRLRVRVSELEREAATLQRTLEVRDIAARDLEREHELLVGSTSWRLTRPLRAVSKLMLGYWRERG